MDKTIFQLNEEMLDVFAELEDNGGEITPELEEKLKNNGEAITNKVKNCCNFINGLKSDLSAIKSETDRLKSLAKSKESTINAITNIVIWAIENYGTEDKKGKKWIDWHTGKVSVRPSTVCEVEQDKIDTLCKIVSLTFANGAFCNTLDGNDSIDVPALIDALQHNKDEELGNIDPIEIEESDLKDISVDVTMSVPLSSILANNGYKTVAAIVQNTNNYKIKGSVDKALLKAKIINGEVTNLAELKENKGLNIR